MSFLMTLRVAFKALARNKLRTALTMLGMIIGVAAVITMVALGSGAQASIEDQIRGAGTNMISIFPGSATAGGVRQGGGSSSRLTVNDAKAIRQVAEVEHVSEGIQSQQQIIAGAANWRTSVIGVNVEYTDIKSWPMKYGAFFTDYDVTSAAKVCTLGVNVSQNLFGDEDPTGAEIRIRGNVFRVLGVMAPKGASSSGQNQDDQIFAPYTTVMKKLQGNEFLNYILASARSGPEMLRREAVAAPCVAARSTRRHDFPRQTQDGLIAARTRAQT